MVQSRVFDLIRQAIAMAVDDEDDRLRRERPVAILENAFAELDEMVVHTRLVMLGDHEALTTCRRWLSERAVPRPDHHLAPEPGHDGHGPGPVGDGPGHGVSGSVNPQPVLDLLIGAAFTALDDDRLRQADLSTLGAELGRHFGILEGLRDAAVDVLGGLAGRDRLLGLLDLLDHFGHPHDLPRLPNELDDCIMAVQQALSRPGNGVSTGMRETAARIDPNTSKIADVSPDPVCAGQTITISSSPSDRFSAVQPADVTVLFSPCGVPGTDVVWAADQVTATVPASASSGQVYFGTPEPPTVVAPGEDLVAVLGSCPLFAGMGGRTMGMAMYDLLPLSICPDTFVVVGASNATVINHRPAIKRFQALDASNAELGNRPVEPGTAVTLSWESSSDTGTASARILAGGQVLYSGLPVAGTVVHSVTPQTMNLLLEVSNGCGTSTRALSIALVRRFSLQPANLILAPGQSATVTLSTSVPSGQAIVAVLVTTEPQRVQISSGVVSIPPNQTQATFQVTGLAPGRPDHTPSGVVIAGRQGYETASASVWVQRPIGDHEVVAYGPSDPGTPKVDVVAVHAAATPGGKVLLFSYDEADWAHMDKAKSALWDPVARVATRVPHARNLFCSGHCYLGDGRLLVAGGQSTAQRFAATIGSWLELHQAFFGAGADHDLHTYDPMTQTWARHRDMPGARWYPPCTTLPNGLALIVGGYADHAQGSMNTDFEIFDGAQNKIIARKYFPGRLYPFVHVLPGGTLFYHAADLTMLFALHPTTREPVVGALAPVYRTAPPGNTRTYNGQGASVLLPLDPDQPDKVRVLVVGGGGAADGKLNRLTTASNTAEIFQFDPSTGSLLGQAGWRTTMDSSGSQTFLTTPRFMADAVLLPDGTVAIIGGAGAGQADDVGGPAIMWVESFDPETETFTTMTPITVPRLYHSCALLLADGSVLIAGSTGSWFSYEVGGGLTNEYRLEMYYPPYLYRGPRPVFTLPSPSIAYGQTVDITVTSGDGTAIERVALLRLGSTTHTNNMDQRHVLMKIVSRSSGSVRVTAPPDGTVAPPGPYLLFLVKGQALGDRVPSIGTHVMVGP
jgi:hypothetical protein